jgi:hypothetical protein
MKGGQIVMMNCEELRNTWSIMDTNGRYEGEIFITYKDLDKTKELQWFYTSNKVPYIRHGDKQRAETQIEKLRELRDLAGYSNTLDWKLVQPESFSGSSEISMDIENLDIAKGCLTKHKKGYREIEKKYKAILKEISKAWREKEGALHDSI